MAMPVARTVLDGGPVDRRQRAGQTEADGADVAVRRRPVIRGRAGAEHLRERLELAVDLDADDLQKAEDGGPACGASGHAAPSDPVAVDEPADADQRLLELLVARRVAGPDVALAGRPEGVARHDRDALLLEQPLGERLVVEAGRDPGEGVERAARLEGRQPSALKPSTTSRRRRSYSASIRSTSARPRASPRAPRPGRRSAPT